MRANGRKWLGGFFAAYGLPRDYLLLDLETSGFDARRDLIIQWSLGVVKDTQLVDVTTQSLNWTKPFEIPLGVLSDKLRHICGKLSLDPDDLSHPFSVAHLETHGVSPTKSFALLRDLLFAAKPKLLVGHNHLAFDIPMLEGNLERFLPDALPCCPASMSFLDTGALAVGIQLGHPIPSHPSLEQACVEILNRKRQTFWKLHTDCVDLFELQDVDDLVKSGHTADADIRIVHKIVEKSRELWSAYSEEHGPGVSRV